MEWNHYSTTELDRLNTSFWSSDVRPWEYDSCKLPCPRCGALAHVAFVGATFGSPPEIHVTCQSCRSEGSVRAFDETQGELDDNKVAEVVKRHHLGLESTCPICHTVMDVNEHATFEDTTYLILCPRCGADGQLAV